MLNFTKKMIITGVEVRTKADNNSYTLIYVLLESGQTLGVVYRGSENLGKLDTLQHYDITFQVKVGKYTNLSIVKVVRC